MCNRFNFCWSRLLTLSFVLACCTACVPEGEPVTFDRGAATRVGDLLFIPRSALGEFSYADTTDFHLSAPKYANEYALQRADTSGDGVWDQLIVRIPEESMDSLRVQIGRTTDPEHYTNIRMAKADGENAFTEINEATRDPDHLGQEIPFFYQMEGPAWENENVGFRMYWDERNGTDIFGKRTQDMVLDEVGIDEDYHALQEWGMDVLKVGTSLGAGSIALMIGDSIYRLGDVPEERYRLLEEGPLRSRFLLEYDDWQVAGRSLDLDWEITILSGTYGYESKITIDGLQGDEELLTGIVNLHSDTLYTERRGDRFVMYTYGPQAELENVLGMAISVDSDDLLGQGEFLPDDSPVTSTYYVRLRLQNGKPTRFRFSAGWEPGNAEFGTREGFAKVIW